MREGITEVLAGLTFLIAYFTCLACIMWKDMVVVSSSLVSVVKLGKADLFDNRIMIEQAKLKHKHCEI